MKATFKPVIDEISQAIGPGKHKLTRQSLSPKPKQENVLKNQHKTTTCLKPPIPIKPSVRIEPAQEEVVTININDIKIDHSVESGTGKFGEISFGKWKQINVALKRSKELAGGMLKEAQIMNKLKHKNVIELYGIINDSGKHMIVMEYMNEGSLDKLMKEKNMEFDQLMFIACQIGEGMIYLSSKLIIHRDLAIRNVLLGGNVAKISDFGLARVLETKKSVYKLDENEKLPMRWYPVEAFDDMVFTLKSDVWSFGIALMELFTDGKIPYEGKCFATCIMEGYRIPKPSNMRKQLYNVIHSCWDSNPDNRPSYETLVEKLNCVKNTFYSEGAEVQLSEYILHATDYIIYYGNYNKSGVVVKQYFGLKSRKYFVKDFRILLLLDELNVVKLLTYSYEDDSLRIVIEKQEKMDHLTFLLLQTFQSTELINVICNLLGNYTNFRIDYFGLLLLEMFSDHNISCGEISEDSIENVRMGKIQIPEKCPRDIFETIKICCVKDVRKRPTLAYLKVLFAAKKA